VVQHYLYMFHNMLYCHSRSVWFLFWLCRGWLVCF